MAKKDTNSNLIYIAVFIGIVIFFILLDKIPFLAWFFVAITVIGFSLYKFPTFRTMVFTLFGKKAPLAKFIVKTNDEIKLKPAVPFPTRESILAKEPLLIKESDRESIKPDTTQKPKHEIDNQDYVKEAYKIRDHIKKALEAMDNTGKWYKDENQATRELVGILTSHEQEAKFQPRLENGIIPDATVGNELIEAKVEPDKTKIDRLIGQLEEYSHLNKNINIVIYGRISPDHIQRIQNLINSQYKGKAILIYLPNPKRVRKNN